MTLRSYIYKSLAPHRRQYRARLLRLPKENLRGVVRGTVHRARGLIPGSIKRRMLRRADRFIDLYAFRFGLDSFAVEQKEKLSAKLPRSKWLPGGFARWRGKTERSTRTPAVPGDIQR